VENVKLLPTIGDSSDPPSKVKWTYVGYMFSRWLNFPYLLMLVLALSPEAFYLFESRADSGETTPQEEVEQQIQLLQCVLKHESSWRNVIADRDADHFCTMAELVEIRQRATFLSCA
jgi:hypothetical protein